MILVSACLLGENCKYTGGNNRNEAVLSFVEGKEYIPFCPEQAGGLPTPRLPSEICGDTVVSCEGDDVTEYFRLGAARALADLCIPLLGVNFGRVGFLTEVPADDWQIWMEALFAGYFHKECHTALAWRALRPEAGADPRPLASGWAINDVVAARGQVARAVSLDLTVDGVFLSRLRCDGLIMSTPLGATAYSASSGGPLAFPTLDAHIITAISPFAGAFPPLVLPAATPVTLTASGDNDDVHLTVDGQESLPLQSGDILEVQGVPDRTPLLVRDPRWYLRRLGQRGFILPGPGNYASLH